MRVAIVNDMALAREVLRRAVLTQGTHTLAWVACDGAEAVRKAAEDRPDAILMDLVMPGMDGVEATRRIMRDHPCPILLVTSSVCGNFSKVYEAMGNGGLDAVDTPTMDCSGRIQNADALLARLDRVGKAIAFSPLRNCSRPTPRPLAAQGPPLVALGASTGGPEAIARILEAFPADFSAAVVIAQHIGADFAPNLVEWLRLRSRLPVRLAKTGDAPTAGEVLLAGRNDHLAFAADGSFTYVSEPSEYPYRPSVDVLFCSLASRYPRPGIAALLTGMGADGARGLLTLKQAGWHTLAQDRESSVVYGMPQAAVQCNAACEVFSLARMGVTILDRLVKCAASQGSRNHSRQL